MPCNIPGVADFFIKVNGQNLQDTLEWQISRIMVDDQIDLPSMFSLELDAEKEDEAVWLNDKKIFAIGHEIQIQFKLSDTSKAVTVIIGEVTSLEVEFNVDSPPRLLVRGYDVRHRLQRGHKIRTFLKKTDSDIAKQIAGEAGLQISVTDSKVKHEYIVQSNQTDFAFLQERVRQIHFEMVLEGKKLLFRPVQNNKSPAIKLSTEEDLAEFRVQLSTTSQANQTEVRGWDIKQKKEFVGKGKASSDSGGSISQKAFGEAKIQLVKQPVMSQEEANQLATAALAANELSFIQAEGSCSGRPDLKAGITVELKGIGQRFNGNYYVTKVNHVFDTNGFSTNFTAWRNA
jgi:uncharacterized protein